MSYDWHTWRHHVCRQYRKHFRTHFSQISLIFAKNDFSGARTWTRVTQEWYMLSWFWLHCCVEWIACYNVVSIPRSLKLEPSGRFSQTRSHNYDNYDVSGIRWRVRESNWIRYYTSEFWPVISPVIPFTCFLTSLSFPIPSLGKCLVRYNYSDES